VNVSLSRLNGMYVGDLSEAELREFTQAVLENRARRIYIGGSGFLGLAKVEVLDNTEDDNRSSVEMCMDGDELEQFARDESWGD
jgi:restriction endonuclease Mrr